MRVAAGLPLVLVAALLPGISFAQATRTASVSRTRYFYYRPDGQGAHAYQTPISMIVEGGFSPFGERRLHEFNFAKGARNLWSSLKNPFRAVDEYGVGDFFYSEFVPNPGQDTGQWVPNWTWHLVGGGFRTRQLKEYFIDRGYEHPALNAWLVAYASHLINELIQAERYPPRAVDAIADLFFFDWVGKLIFDLDVVNEIATETFHLTDWTTQTQWNPVTGRLLNVGQLYWLRFQVYGPWSVSALTGELTNTVNGTFAINDDEEVSLGFGFKPHDIIVTPDGVPVADTLRMTVGFYYSRRDNPVLVATYESTLAFARADGIDQPLRREDDSALTINLYPGWFSIHGFEPGFSLATKGEAVFLAISHGSWPVGVALSEELWEDPEQR